jgi:hypothetical protein
MDGGHREVGELFAGAQGLQDVVLVPGIDVVGVFAWSRRDPELLPPRRQGASPGNVSLAIAFNCSIWAAVTPL